LIVLLVRPTAFPNERRPFRLAELFFEPESGQALSVLLGRPDERSNFLKQQKIWREKCWLIGVFNNYTQRFSYDALRVAAQ
jgi:hypothetical protein